MGLEKNYKDLKAAYDLHMANDGVNKATFDRLKAAYEPLYNSHVELMRKMAEEEGQHALTMGELEQIT